jgi:hypothetical protein
MIHKPLTMLVPHDRGANKGTKTPCWAKAIRVGDITSYERFPALTAASKRSHTKAHWRRRFKLIKGPAS